MKLILTLFCILSVYEVFAQGDAPPFTQGQKQTTFDVATRIRVPNNQSTKTSSSQALLETGNLNLLSNSGFEHSTFSTGWVTTGTTGTMSAELSSLISGNKAFKVITSAQNISLVQDSTLYAAQLAGMQGYIQMFCSNTAPSVSLCERAAGVTSSTNCVTLATDGAWKQYEIPVVLSATSNGISIAATSTTGTTICDDAYVGLISGKTPEVSQAQLVVSGNFVAATGANLSRTGTSLGAFATAVNFPAPTYSINDWGCASTDANKFAITCSNVPAGKVVFRAYSYFFITSGSADVTLAIFDGVTTTPSQQATNSVGGAPSVVYGEFNYTSAGSRTFEVYASASASTINMSASVSSGGGGNPRFEIIYYPPASKIYSQNNNNLDAASFTPVSTWVSNVTQTGRISREGRNARISYQILATGAPTATNLTLTIPNSLLIDTAALPAVPAGVTSLQVSTKCYIVDSGTTSFPCVATYTSTSTVSIRAMNAATTYVEGAAVSQSVPMTWANNDSLNVEILVPIIGWSESMITGTFAEMMKVPTVAKPKMCTITFGGASETTNCTSNPCTLYQNECGGTPTIARASTGSYQVTFPNGTWANSTLVDCRNTCVERSVPAYGQVSPNSTVTGSFVHQVYGVNSTFTAVDAHCKVTCKGSAP